MLWCYNKQVHYHMNFTSTEDIFVLLGITVLPTTAPSRTCTNAILGTTEQHAYYLWLNRQIQMAVPQRPLAAGEGFCW